ncbi:hypothetical protein MD484_g6890, partial [Candolleomyces efflorescens]
MSSPQQWFFLGATGYIGSQFLESAKRDASLFSKLREFTLVALVRDPENAKAKKLQEVWPGVVLVKGTLDDVNVIEEQARKSALTFNSANCDHEPSIQGATPKFVFTLPVYRPSSSASLAIITGLQKRSEDHPNGPKPLYIHISGLAILSDNSRGEKDSVGHGVHYSDTTFRLEDFPPTNPHQPPDRIIHAAAAQEKNGIRAVSVYPATVYGVGDGITPDAPLLRIFGPLYVQTGLAGTWGPGENAISVVHIKDTGAALVKIFNIALEGKKEDVDYFISDDKAESWGLKGFAQVVGKILHAHDLLKDPEPKPFPEAVTSQFGDFGWSVFAGTWQGSSDRLRAEGWEPTETAKVSFWDALPVEVENFVTAYKASRS